ncbi:proline--tRNA ligase [Steroidobacter denitrificans]|uniref:Proline--tRNA ligase n=1 Tax=Steroidobacter denitrificans TaxID=465721 RepID=A0A127FCY5_STEDE|nr:proline--tRNA ligase [Steroidobacter denitrificans]AMN48266.1 proline--tRNA ligase [Steroidobacter denitrificans]
MSSQSSKKSATAISPTRGENYAEWYQQVVKAADMAENSPVRGCMVIKPWGYSLWENIQRVLDDKFKETGHQNAYFPLFIPLSFLQKEAAHVEGFAKECAVVTHHRLEVGSDGKLIPTGELEEPLIVRPTSETIIGDAFARWVQSYRDLPLLINQWANVVRWEMRTRMFLRTAEFLWQEGHTAHATREEALEETMRMLEVYAEVAEQWMAVPVIKGEKTAGERFPGAEQTFCIEAMMQDRKALQAGTSHFLGQNFAKASEIRFLDSQGEQQYAWTTSWGVSTRLIGGLIMTHADDDGLVLPPKVAPVQVVILPIYRTQDDRSRVLEYCHAVARALRSQRYAERPLSVQVDERDERGGDKVWHWIKKGVPLRVEIGPRDIEKDALLVARRDRAHKDKQAIPRGEFVATVTTILESIQEALFERARSFREQHTRRIDTRQEFYDWFTPERVQDNEPTPIHGGFALAHFSGDVQLEAQIKADLGVTVRCIPQDGSESGICPFTGAPSQQRVVWAKSY